MIVRDNVPNELRRAVFERDNHTCLYCGGVGEETDLEVDHIIPVSKGGNDDIRNLCTACWKCNRSKGARILTTNELQRIANKINSPLEYLLSLTSEEPKAEQEKRVKVSVYLNHETYESIRLISANMNQTVSDILEVFARNFVDLNQEAIQRMESAWSEVKVRLK